MAERDGVVYSKPMRKSERKPDEVSSHYDTNSHARGDMMMHHIVGCDFLPARDMMRHIIGYVASHRWIFFLNLLDVIVFPYLIMF